MGLDTAAAEDAGAGGSAGGVMQAYGGSSMSGSSYTDPFAVNHMDVAQEGGFALELNGTAIDRRGWQLHQLSMFPAFAAPTQVQGMSVGGHCLQLLIRVTQNK